MEESISIIIVIYTPWKVIGGDKSYTLTINMKKKILSNMENVFMQFMETSQASFKSNQNLIQNLEIQVGKSYSMGNCWLEQELQPQY